MRNKRHVTTFDLEHIILLTAHKNTSPLSTMASGWTPSGPPWAPPPLFVAPSAAQQAGPVFIVSGASGVGPASRGRRHPSQAPLYGPMPGGSSAFMDFPPRPQGVGLLPRPPIRPVQPHYGYPSAGNHTRPRCPFHGQAGPGGNLSGLPFTPPRYATQQPIRLMSSETVTSTVTRSSRSSDVRRQPSHRNSPSDTTTNSRSNDRSSRERSRSGLLPRPSTPVYSMAMSPPFSRRTGYSGIENWSPPPFYDDDDYDMDYVYHLEYEPYELSDDYDSDNDEYFMRAFIRQMRNVPSPPARLTGGYECQFVTPFSSDVQTECSICLSILREPFLVDCCGYRFCKSCIETVKEDHKPCPLCNKNFKTFPDKQLQRMLCQKEIYCKHKEDGCEWTGELTKLDEHLNADCGDSEKHLEGCGYIMLKCSHCEKMVQRQEFKLHNIRCSGEKYTCEYCNKYSASYHKVSEEHWPECPGYPVKCPNGCKDELKRSDLNKHLACDCPQTIIQCDLAHFGCEVRLPRAQMTTHIQDGAMDHISLLTTKYRQAQDENNSLKEEFADLAFEVHCLQDMNASIQQENDSLLEELEDSTHELEEKDQEIERLRKLLSKSTAPSNITTQLPPTSTAVQIILPTGTCTSSANGKSLVISNLPPNVNEQKLKSLFGPFGRVIGVSLNLKTSEAVLVFEDSGAISRAMAKGKGAGLRLHGQTLCLREANY